MNGLNRALQKRFNAAATQSALALLGLISAGCSNSILSNLSQASKVTINATASSTPTSRYQISSVQFGSTSASPTPGSPDGGGSAGNVTLLFDPTRSTGLLSESCGAANSAKPCACRYEWTEVNNTGETAVNIPRLDQRPLKLVQANLAVCDPPRAIAEIPPQTVIKISIISAGANPASFSVPAYSYTKTNSNTLGSFQDAQGASFSNIHRYSCFSTVSYPKGLSNLRRKKTQDEGNANAPFAYEVMATQFCSRKPGDNAEQQGNDLQGGDTCPTIDSSESNQAAMFNLYIRSTDRGQINAFNGTFSCPKVNESLFGTGLDFWPLDSTFALALSNNSTFNVGVEAYSKLAIAGDPVNSGSSKCTMTGAGGSGSGGAPGGGGAGGDSPAGGDGQPDPGASGSPGAMVKSCIGFAAKPASDGTCPYFTTPQGTIRPTFRLRRFITLYPPLYGANGDLMARSQDSDVVYVLDRPVNSSAADPLKPYTMRGPKPCPFAYYDETGVLSNPNDPQYPTGMPGYAATNYSGWNGTNVDGIEFPNKDTAGNSCSSALAILNENKTRWSVTTLNARNPVFKRMFVRPIRAWAPHYMEDTSFQACAPLADPLKDPPLHFSKDPSTGNVAWCAESYPTQNPNVARVDKLNTSTNSYPSRVSPFTSHVVKNASGPACQATPLPLGTIASAYVVNPSAANSTSCKSSTQTTYGPAWHPNNYIVDAAPPINGACPNTSIFDSANNKCHFCAHQTCDRTVAATPEMWPHYPLLARPSQVEAALASDSTYGCVMTFDNGGGKAGKSSPAEGCCGSTVRVWTGFDASPSPNPMRANSSAHLEPSEKCLIPNY